MNIESSIRELREKCRILRRNARDVQGYIAKEIELLDKRVTEMEREAADMRSRLKNLEEKESPGTKYSEASVRDLDSLRAFVVKHFGDHWLQEYRTPDKKEACRQLRDRLADICDAIERLNDQPQHPLYPNVPYTSHADAICFRDIMSGNCYAVDFCKASSAPGKMQDSLTWIQREIMLW